MNVKCILPEEFVHVLYILVGSFRLSCKQRAVLVSLQAVLPVHSAGCKLTKPAAWLNKQSSSLSLGAISESEAKAGFKRFCDHWAEYSGAAKSLPTGKVDTKAVFAGNNYAIHFESRDDDGTIR